ncbi:MAG: GntR family transcriptional regulator [Alphaproteobacteria bacterium]
MFKAELRPLPHSSPNETTGLVFTQLYNAIVYWAFKPGMKISEAEIAKKLGVSRQPVRDAFFQLSQLGLIAIRPQRATLVTKISEPAVMKAYFIRQSLELTLVEEAIKHIDSEGEKILRNLLDRQVRALANEDNWWFHQLDDEFHRKISIIAGHGYVWDLIKNHKAHMDRLRFLTLPYGSDETLQEHHQIYEAIIRKDENTAKKNMRFHLSKICKHLPLFRNNNAQYFDETNYEV